MSNHHNIIDKPVVIVIGPTASGKTGFAEELMAHRSGVMINADVGQLYTPLTIGTAKPLYDAYPFLTFGFDVLDTPQDMSVSAYRTLVVQYMQQHQETCDFFCLVGGSHFYVKSLFYPPQDIPKKESLKTSREFIETSCQSCSLWERLHAIDPERAACIHPHDRYRLERALHIWQTTGIKPSVFKPALDVPFRRCFIFYIKPDRHILYNRIVERTQQMLAQGWIEEARACLQTPWESFIRYKGLIGYPEIMDWIVAGEDHSQYAGLIEKITQETMRYAKRQMTFVKSFEKQLLLDSNNQTCALVWKTLSSEDFKNAQNFLIEI